MSPDWSNDPKEQKALAEYRASLLTEEDVYLFNEGNHYRLYEHLGAHSLTLGATEGTYFAVWAPMPNGCRSSVTSTAGAKYRAICIPTASRGSGKDSCPA